MMNHLRKRRQQQEADLDITSFMNLMIILVPVLLMSMVFSHITVLDLKLPDISDGAETPLIDKKLELVLHPEFVDVNFPVGVRLKRIGLATLEDSNTDGVAAPLSEIGAIDDVSDVAAESAGYDLKLLSQVLQEVKRQLKDKGVTKRDITILSLPDTDYQTIVSVMDTARSFKAVVATSVVDAELFPEISLGDAPVSDEVASLAGGVK